MKAILFVIVILSLFALAPGPACPGSPPPEKTKPPVITKPPPEVTEPPPIITEPPEKTEPPVITEPPEKTEPPATEPPEETEPPPGTPPSKPVPTERDQPHPETQVTPDGPPRAEGEPREIRLPAGGFGPPPAQPMSTSTIARWGLLFLIGLAGIFLAGNALRLTSKNWPYSI